MWWIAMAGAAAAEPTVETLDNGTIRGIVEVPANSSVVKAFVTKPVELAKVASVGSEISVAPAEDANCRMVTTFSPHPIMPVTYTSKDCDTMRGVTSKLVTSKQLSHLEAEWKVEEAPGDRSRVIYDLDIKTNMALPGFLVRRSTRKAVAEALEGLRQAFAKNP